MSGAIFRPRPNFNSLSTNTNPMANHNRDPINTNLNRNPNPNSPNHDHTPRTENSLEIIQLSVPGEFWNICSQDYSFPGTFVPMTELSFSGPFVPWNICSLYRSFPETFVPGTLDLSCRRPFVHLSPGPLTKKEQCNKQKLANTQLVTGNTAIQTLLEYVKTMWIDSWL